MASDDECEVDESVRLTGTVSKFYDQRGFGFIQPSEGKKKPVFVHWEQISSSDKWPKLEIDTEVEYHLGTKKGRPTAFNVTLAGGEDINLGEEKRKLSKNRVTGTVKFFNSNGFGFIETNKAITWPWKMPAGSDVYVSRAELNIDDDSEFFNIKAGMEVEFNVFVQDGKENIAAANVTAPGGEPLEGCRIRRKGKGKGKGKSGKSGKKGKGSGKGSGKSSKGSGKDDNGKKTSKGGGKGTTVKITPIKKTIFKVKHEQYEEERAPKAGKKGKGKGKSRSKN